MAKALYFSAVDASGGRELWKLKADGSVVRAADINQGTSNLGGSNPYGFTTFNSELYFSAYDGITGTGLWKVKADGRVVLANDLEPQVGSSLPRFGSLNGELYFSAAGSGYAYDYELWKLKADGSIVLVAELRPGSNGGHPANFTAFNGELYFTGGGSDGGLGSTLWKVRADGSVVQAPVSDRGDRSSFLTDDNTFVVFNGELYFPSSGQLWKVRADGSIVVVSDVNPVFGAGSLPPDFTAFNGELYFGGQDSTHGYELWKVRADGSVVSVADIFPGDGSFYPNSSRPYGFTAFNGELYFLATDAAHGSEIWKVRADGSVALAADINPGTANTYLRHFTVFNGEMYFAAADSSFVSQLWKMTADGSVIRISGISLNVPANYDASFTSLAPYFTAFNGELYFSANDGTHGFELWKIKPDGSAARATDINPGPGHALITGLTVFETLFDETPTPSDFNGDGKGDILWRNDDGTVAAWMLNGTSIVSGGNIGAPGHDWHVQNNHYDFL